MLARYQSREFDPLWAFVLSECLDYNKSIDNLRSQLLQFLSSSNLEMKEKLNIHIQHIDRASSSDFEDWLRRLQRGVCPSFSRREESDAASSYSWEELFSQLTERRKMIDEWLSSGRPPAVRLHLLRSPSSLLHALKEKFSVNIDNAVEKVHIKVTVLEAASATPEAVASMNDPDINFGCNLIVTDCYLHNGVYKINQEEEGSVEALPPFSTSSLGQVNKE
jgi:hypothetical protein